MAGIQSVDKISLQSFRNDDLSPLVDNPIKDCQLVPKRPIGAYRLW